MIKSYKGLIVHDGQQTIPLHTNDGRTGYRLIKLEVIPETPYGASAEHVLKVYKIEQTGITTTINFGDNNLLGTAIINNDTAGYRYPSNPTIIFDNEILNQDIFITHKCADGDTSLNYYIELEQYPITENQALVAIIKDLREEQ